MKGLNNSLWAVLGMILCSLLFSCKKENSPTTEGLFVYTGGGNAAHNVIKGGSFAVLRSTILSGQNTAFPVLITRAYTQDIQVTARIDTTLISQYDSLYKVVSPRFPEGTFTLENQGNVRIDAGETRSADSIRISLADVSKLIAGTNNFVIPVVLTTATGIPVSSNRQVMFVQVEVNSIASGIATFSGDPVVDLVLQQVNGVNIGTDEAYFAAILNKPMAKAVPVSVEVNATAIEIFNTQNGTDYQAFPAGSYQLVKAEATVNANETQSADSIRIKLTNLSLFAAGTDYLLALKAVDNPSADMPPTDESKNMVYVHVSVFVNNIDPANSGLLGTPIDRTAWSVAVSSVFGNGIGANMLDGDSATAWTSGSGSTHMVELDMGTASQVKGFLLSPNYVYPSENITKMNVYSSTNGTVWKQEGAYSGSAPGGSATDPDVKTVRFIAPVNARYFRFEILESNGRSYTGMGELNAIQ